MTNDHCHQCDSESDELWVHARCHMDVPISMILDREANVLAAHCGKCYTKIVEFPLAEIPATMHCTKCTGGSPNDIFVWPCWRRGEGLLVLKCYFCDRETARLKVREGA